MAVALFLAACGGAEGETAPTGAPNTPATGDPTELSPGATETAEDPPAAETVTVGASADFGGFRYHVIEAGLGESLGTPVLIVSIDVENLGTEAGRPPSDLHLRTPDGLVDNSGFGVTADIAPGSSDSGIFEFQVGTGFAFEGATVLIGRDGGAQAEIPMAGGSVVSLAPMEVVVDEVGTADLVEIRLDRVIVDWHSLGLFGESADTGTAYLTVVVDITLGDKSRTALDTFEILLPSGEVVTPKKAPNEVLESGVTAEGLEVAFIVPDPFAGEYVLRLLNLSRFPEGTVAEVPFELGGP